MLGTGLSQAQGWIRIGAVGRRGGRSRAEEELSARVPC